MSRRSRSPLQAALAVELARAGLTQAELARQLGLPPTTLSSWLRGSAPAPDALVSRVEASLGLQPGTLPQPA